MSANSPTSTPETVRTEARAQVHQTLREVMAHIAQLSLLHQALADAPDLYGDQFVALQEKQARVSPLLLAVGQAVVSWCRLGGTLILEDPLPSPAPSSPLSTETDAPPEAETDAPPEAETEGPPEAETEGPPEAELEVLREGELEEEDTEESIVIAAGPPATAESVSRLAALFQQGGQFARNEPPIRLPPLPSREVAQLGEPPEVQEGGAWDRELSALVDAIGGREGWRHYAREVQRDLLALVVARLRHLQDEAAERSARSGSLWRMDSIFQDLTRFSKTYQPGSVVGLSRGHRPSQPSWRQEALVWWRRLSKRCGLLEEPTPKALLQALGRDLEDGLSGEALVARLEGLVAAGVQARDERLLVLMGPYESRLARSGRCRTLQQALKERRGGGVEPEPDEGEEEDAELLAPVLGAEEEPDEPDEPDMGVDGAIVERTQGRRAVIVGGDQRVGVAERIQAAFGFSDVQWETGVNMRRVGALAERVQQGSVDVVIFLKRFMSHKLAHKLQPVAKEAPGVLMVWVDRGYGVTAVSLALARSLGLASGDRA